MSTALFDVATRIKDRRREIDLLLEQAVFYQSDRTDLFETMCRSCSVLLAAHLEGFLKDVTRGLVLDFNFNCENFSTMPESMQRTFCEKIVYYEGVNSREIDVRIKQLRAFFSKNSVPIEMEYFSYKENVNKNPSSETIERAFKKIGVNDILCSLGSTSLEVVFDNDRRSDYVLLRDLKRFRSKLWFFPYRPLPSPYKFNYKVKNKETLWHTFVEEILSRRHQIVHGDTMSNIADIQTLVSDAVKLDVLMHGLMFSSVEALFRK